MVKPKKHLGQHFLIDTQICADIASAIQKDMPLIEIGPGTGALTKHLHAIEDFTVCEIDQESIVYLKEHYPNLKIIDRDFLTLDLQEIFQGRGNVIGNFPYNISSQILFKVFENKDLVETVVGMFQKEVAQRVIAKPGSKIYGILSVLLGAFYEGEYLFTVLPEKFDPPPKVDSGVIRLTRNKVTDLSCDLALFVKIVKATFNQRRKMIRKTLQPFLNQKIQVEHIPFHNKRPEQLGVEEFIKLTEFVQQLKA